jgi:hypothetical protein
VTFTRVSWGQLRAQIVLAASRGGASARIAADLHLSVDTVRKWRGRFAARGLDGLKDLPPLRAATADQRAGTGRGGFGRREIIGHRFK